jgi:protein phosphatase
MPGEVMGEDEEPDTAELPPLPGQPAWPATFSSRIEVDLGAASHRGHVRENNEDCYLVSRLEREFDTLMTNLPKGSLPAKQTEVAYGLLVADGMGGAAAGEVASSDVVRTLVKLVLRTPDWHMRLDPVGAKRVLTRFDHRFRQLRDSLIARAQADPSLAGMGTTLTLAVSFGADLIIAHVGDSRAYLFHNGELHLLTRDQTLAQDLADSGVIRPEELNIHYARHILTGVIATAGNDPQPELHQMLLADHDQVLLCTDGLNEMLTDNAISEVLGRNLSASEACDALVEQALEAGGMDNVTVALARYRIPARLPEPD